MGMNDDFTTRDRAHCGKQGGMATINGYWSRRKTEKGGPGSHPCPPFSVALCPLKIVLSTLQIIFLFLFKEIICLKVRIPPCGVLAQLRLFLVTTSI